MKTFKLKIDWETEIKAEDEQDAYDKFWENQALDIQQDLETFITDILEIKEQACLK